MLRRFATLLLLSAMLTGTSQAFTISLSGTMDLIGPALAGDPPGYLGPGTYAYSAVIQAEPVNTLGTNPTFVTLASLDLTSAGLAPFVFGGGLVTVTSPDTVVADIFGGPDGSTVTFTFVNSNNPLTNSLPNNDNVRMVINDPAAVITTTGAFFPGIGPIGTTNIGSAVSTAVVSAPEPSSFALLAVLSIGGAGIYQRRKRAKSAA